MKNKYASIIIITVLCVFLGSCGFSVDINSVADQRLSKMKSPVILIGKRENDFGYSITLKDSSGCIVSFGNGTIIGTAIGESRQIGDTIK